MCIVSFMSDGFKPTGPLPGEWQGGGLKPLGQWPTEELQLLRKAIDLLERIDKKLEARDCKDDIKERFLRNLDELLESRQKPAQ